jgi:peptidyl-prolyl cis-trans isomerase D
MPFAVFRRHQRKLLAIFAILAMFGFVLADSLPRLLNAGYGGGNQNPEVVRLYGKSIRRSDVSDMATQRNNANLFMAQLLRMPGRPLFGDLSTRSIVDALILEHEADAMRMPVGPEAGREWLKRATGGMMNREIFEATLASFGNKITGEQILTDIANQARILNVRRLLTGTVVTPLDVYQTYRDQNERISAKAVAFPAEAFVAKVGEPSKAEVQAFYDKYKDELPNPARDTPGFKVPRQIQVEILSIDGSALAEKIKERLTEGELLSYYENRKGEFKKPSEFPDEIFQGKPELTPPQVRPFAEVRPYLATSLAEEKAQAEIVAKFEEIKDGQMVPFADKYLDARDEIEESKKQGEKVLPALPRWTDLKDAARKAGLDYEVTPLLDREQAEHYGEIGGAEVGLSRMSGGRKFAAEFFDPRSNLFEPVELTDSLGRRFLARKVEDHEPRVPPLDEIHTQVIAAWKALQARPLAEKAARDFAETVRKEAGTIKQDIVEGRPVITIPPISRLQPGFPLPGMMFQNGPPTLTEIPQVPYAGPELRDAYFGLEPGAVAVAPNQPKTTYYVLTLNDRLRASFATLYAPNGDYFRYQREAQEDAFRHREEDQMRRLRDQAGLKPGWVPSDEANREPAT